MSTTFKTVKNNAQAELYASIDADDTEITVVAGQGANLPASGAFWLTIEDEIVLVSSRSTDTLTLGARGEQSTTAVPHDAGEIAYLFLTAQSITDMATAINALEAKVQPRQVNDAGMTDVPGTEGEIVYNLNDDKFYGCTATSETAATWAAFH